jgi:hypothetical protein
MVYIKPTLLIYSSKSNEIQKDITIYIQEISQYYEISGLYRREFIFVFLCVVCNIIGEIVLCANHRWTVLSGHTGEKS